MSNKFGIVFVLLSVLLFSGVYAKAFTVKGGDAKGLLKAVDAAKAGDSILILSGEFVLKTTLNLTNKSDLTIVAEDDTYIRSGDLTKEVVKIAASKNLTLSNLHFQHEAPEEETNCDASVMSIVKSTSVTLSGCEFTGIAAIGTSVSGSDRITLTNCAVHNNSLYAFNFGDSGLITIAGCVIENNNQFLVLKNVISLMMTGNKITEEPVEPEAPEESGDDDETGDDGDDESGDDDDESSSEGDDDEDDDSSSSEGDDEEGGQ